MSISSIANTSSTPTDVTRVGLEGFRDAQAALQAAADVVASGNTDPAVILDVRQAELSASVSAAVVKADERNFNRLLDILV